MKHKKSSGNVFLDIGFDEIEAEELAVKTDLIALLGKEIKRRRITQMYAAKLCGTDQPTLSKAMNGKLDSVTIDRLAKWVTCLGYNFEISVKRATNHKPEQRGSMSLHAR